jgi:hypothetical protein
VISTTLSFAGPSASWNQRAVVLPFVVVSRASTRAAGAALSRAEADRLTAGASTVTSTATARTSHGR